MRKSIALVLALFSVTAAAELRARDAWIPEAPPGATVMAGYLQLHNDGQAPRALVAAGSPRFQRVELHRSVHENGMARMRHEHRIELPAGGGVAIEPGGYHLMLMQPAQRLQHGERVPLTLEFDDGSRLQIEAEVRRVAGRHGHGEGQGHGHGHGHH